MVKRVSIHGMDIEYQTDYRNVKHPRLEFKTGELVLVLPKGYQEEKELIAKHKDWVHKKSSIIKMAKIEASKRKIEQNRSEEELKSLIHKFTKKFSEELNTTIRRVYFRELKSKWGSCSSKGNLTFSLLLKYLPENLIRYVVLHEVVHRIEKKHQDRFWSLVSQYFRNYAEKEKELLVYWFLVQDFVDIKGSSDEVRAIS